jgi:hypothetical protein
MSRIRAVVTLPYTSGLPEDVVVNTFHFLTDTSPASAGERNEILVNVTAFYNSDFGTPGDPLSEYIGNLVSRAALACRIDLFDLADLEPRQPIQSTTFTLGATSSTNNLPAEVACCASFQADPVSGIPQSRRRGRVYIGPLNYDANTGTSGRPATVFRQAIADAMEGMFDLQAGSGVAWCVYSRAGDAMAAVTNGWVDDEWDTMRSRGRDATGRLTWP